MEGTVNQFDNTSTPEAFAIQQMKQTALTMSTWLKFLGIVSIISGAISAITIVGIIFAWLPIWMGVLLFQAGDRASGVRYSEDLNSLAQMMEKLKMYFVVYAVAIIVSLAFVILLFAFAGSMLHEFNNMFPGMMDSY
jgi:flagellar biosynthesis protein FlhB